MAVTLRLQRRISFKDFNHLETKLEPGNDEANFIRFSGFLHLSNLIQFLGLFSLHICILSYLIGLKTIDYVIN